MPYTVVDKGSKYFNTILYTGTGASLAITGVGFQPDWVWIKSRSVLNDHVLFDVLRGVGNRLVTNTTGVETFNATSLTSFDTDGFTVGAGSARWNSSGTTYASWNWKANGAGVSNTVGTITSTVSANTTAGFSIVTYTGTGVAGSVGHGLGVTPAMYITKRRDVTQSWIVYNKNIGNNILTLETTNASVSNTAFYSSVPNTTRFFPSTDATVNANTGTYVTYCFAEVKGFSKFGSYTGNGSTDGTFVYTGFKPAFFMVKRTDATGSWIMVDNKRNTFNPETLLLLAHSSNAEENTTSFSAFFGDFLSNGIKLRDGTIYTGGTNFNISGATYIYMAFAENPFVSSKGIPCTAR